MAIAAAESVMFETQNEAILPKSAFYKRLALSFLATLGIVAFSLLFGGIGYHYLGGLEWIDAVLDAAMILTGMGPVHQLNTFWGKVFAICYALYSGIAFLSMIAVLAAPIVHRFLHQFHLDDND